MYYKTCPHCGSNLDPSETCDCQQERRNDPKDAATENRKETASNGKNQNGRA